MSQVGGGGGGAGDGINQIAAGTQTAGSSGTVLFQNSNGITFGMSNSSVVTASHNGLTSQSNQAMSGSNGSFTFQTATFGNLNGMSFYTSNGSVVGSYTVPTQTVQTQGFLNSISLVGNTAGQTSAGTGSVVFAGGPNITLSGATAAGGMTLSISAGAGGAGDGVNILAAGTQTANTTGTVLFNNANGITFGMANSSVVTASHNGLTSQSNQALSAANGSFAFQTATFANSNGVSFSTGTQGMFASHNGITSQSNQQISAFAVSNTTQSSSGTFNASSVQFAGAGIASVGISNGSVVISVPSGGGNGATMSWWENMPGHHASGSAGLYSNATIGFSPAYIPQQLTATQAKALFSVSLQSSTNNTMLGTISYGIGLYTKNGQTLSLASSGSASFNWSATSNGSTSRYNGPRELTVPININATPGNYWIGTWLRTTNGGTSQGSIGMTVMGGLGHTIWSGPWGAATNSTLRLMDGLGYLSVSQTTLLGSVDINQINHQSNIRHGWVGFRATT